MIWSSSNDAPSGRPGPAVRPVLAACGLALVASLAACSTDSADGAAADDVATYADGSADGTDTSSGSDSLGDDGATADDDGTAAEGDGTAAEGDGRRLSRDVVVTYWHWDADAGAVEAAGFVDAWVEDGGTCTLSLSRDGTVLSADAPAMSDANTTSCGRLGVSVPAGNTGDWQAVLAYESSSGQTGSEPFTVTVE